MSFKRERRATEGTSEGKVRWSSSIKDIVSRKREAVTQGGNHDEKTPDPKDNAASW